MSNKRDARGRPGVIRAELPLWTGILATILFTLFGQVWLAGIAEPVLPENTYCLIFLTFFRGDVSLVSSVIVRIQNHEAHCLRPVTPCV